MPEGFAGRIEDNRRQVGLRHRIDAAQHAEKALHRAGGLAGARREGGERMVGAKEVIGAVDKKEFRHKASARKPY